MIEEIKGGCRILEKANVNEREYVTGPGTLILASKSVGIKEGEKKGIP